MTTATEAKVADVKKLINESAATAASTTNKMIDNGTAQTRATMEKTMDQATKATEGLLKVAEDAAEFSRGNIEAITKATQVYFAGVQDLGKQTMALVQGLADHTMAGAKALGSVRSLKEAAEIQASYARTAMEKSFSELQWRKSCSITHPLRTLPLSNASTKSLLRQLPLVEPPDSLLQSFPSLRIPATLTVLVLLIVMRLKSPSSVRRKLLPDCSTMLNPNVLGLKMSLLLAAAAMILVTLLVTAQV
jgi:flagellar biosynthesis regulator FlaF